MFILIADALENVHAGFTFLNLESKEVSFKISLITLCYLSVMFDFIETVILNISSFMCLTSESHVIPFPAIFALRNTGIHIYFSNCYNVMISIETSIDEIFCFCTTL